MADPSSTIQKKRRSSWWMWWTSCSIVASCHSGEPDAGLQARGYATNEALLLQHAGRDVDDAIQAIQNEFTQEGTDCGFDATHDAPEVTMEYYFIFRLSFMSLTPFIITIKTIISSLRNGSSRHNECCARR